MRTQGVQETYDVARLREWRASVASKHDDVERNKADVVTDVDLAVADEWPNDTERSSNRRAS